MCVEESRGLSLEPCIFCTQGTRKKWGHRAQKKMGSQVLGRNGVTGYREEIGSQGTGKKRGHMVLGRNGVTGIEKNGVTGY